MKYLIIIGMALLIGCQESSTVVNGCDIRPEVCKDGVEFKTKESRLTIHFMDEGIDAFEKFGVKVSLNGSPYGIYKLYDRSELTQNNALTLVGEFPVIGGGALLSLDLLLETHGVQARMYLPFPADGEDHVVDVNISGELMICGESTSGCALGMIKDSLPKLNYTELKGRNLVGEYRDTNTLFGIEKTLTLDSIGGYYITTKTISSFTISGLYSEAGPQVGKIEVLSDSTIRLWPIFCVSISGGSIDNYTCTSNKYSYGTSEGSAFLGGYTRQDP